MKAMHMDHDSPEQPAASTREDYKLEDWAPTVRPVTDGMTFDADGNLESRSNDDLAAAEQELHDRVWYNRSLGSEITLGAQELTELRRVATPARKRIEAENGADNLGPYDDFEWGMLNGRLSAIRWALGYEWDFLDT
jgi:hypothetical protein